MQRLPPRAQEQILSQPQSVARFAQSLLVRRELARRAEASGLPDDPKVAATLRAARERALADAALDQAEGAPPERATLERLARNEYDAAPEKFDTPEQIRVRHILVAAKSCEPEARARELRAKAVQPGADFAALARENSDDPGSAARGGDLGLFARGKMAPAFESAAFALKEPGEISDVVKTEFGYHVIRLEERTAAARQPFDAVRESLVNGIVESEARARRQRLLDSVATNIVFDPGAIESVLSAGGAAPKPN